MELKLYNTLTRQKDVFTPIKPGAVSLYTCGPTVYNYAHLGNLRAYIFADVLRRTLVYNGYKVKQVMNITDVGHLTSDADTGEDKLEKGASREGKTVWDVAKFYERAFQADTKALNILPPSKYTRATDHIKEQVAMVQQLEKNGLTYTTQQAVYFDVLAFEKKYPGEYTKLSGQKLSEKKVGARDEVYADPDKRHPADFALWFLRVGKYADHVMHWPSPWGDGFPGWHIECSAMSTKYLGKHFDIHTGGIDHIAVHHTNERAQNIGALGTPAVERWMHNEFLVVDKGAKMAKSGENFLTPQSVTDKGLNPLAYRYFCLGTHYRQPLSFSWAALNAAANALTALYTVMAQPGLPKVGCAELEAKFLAALNDDLNTPQALAVVWETVKSDYPLSAKKRTLLKFDAVLGLGLSKVKKIIIPAKIKKLADERLAARQSKDWPRSDELRAEIERAGYTIEDAEDNYRLKKIREK
ncbi:cysteine--tRNA ligase [Candidatus Falkowbacteria bacterium]|nr:cysteine--tRNA ligase [Candidatus Falkowbacteria bacterium]